MDLIMCDGKDCEKKDKCLRYTGKVNEFRQAYFSPTPTGESCEFFINNKKEIGK